MKRYENVPKVVLSNIQTVTLSESCSTVRKPPRGAKKLTSLFLLGEVHGSQGIELGALDEGVSGVWRAVCIECKRLELERS